MEENQTIRVHRLGSITTGATLVVGGVLFLLCSVFNIMTYEMVFSYWPVILVGLGIEILFFNAKGGNVKYDKGAVFMLLLMTVLSMGLAGADMIFKYANWHLNF